MRTGEEIKKEFTPFKFLVFLLIIAVSIYLLQILSLVLANISDLISVIILAWLLKAQHKLILFQGIQL